MPAALHRRTSGPEEVLELVERHAVPLGPASFEVGAALGIPFLTAHRARLRDPSFPLAEIAAAHALAETSPAGRVLLDIP